MINKFYNYTVHSSNNILELCQCLCKIDICLCSAEYIGGSLVMGLALCFIWLKHGLPGLLHGPGAVNMAGTLPNY